MTNPQIPPAQDPDNAPEIFAAGPTNCLVFGPMAMLTFTHIRHDSGDLFQGTQPAKTATIVRARIIMPTESLAELRGLIDTVLANADTPQVGASTSPGVH